MKKLMLSLLCMLFTLSAAVFFAGCDENTTTDHTHAFVEQKIEQDFLSSPATCTERAMYYFSCSCGEKGIGSFYYGEALGHNYVYGVCTRCGVVDPFFKPTDGLQYTLNSDGSSYSCTGIGTAIDANVVIAKVYSGLPVTSIGSSAFSGCSGLISITIPGSVTSIGSSAFSGCSGLTKIEFKGTMAQWNAISKNNNWDYNTGSYTVYCTDGNITK